MLNLFPKLYLVLLIVSGILHSEVTYAQGPTIPEATGQTNWEDSPELPDRDADDTANPDEEILLRGPLHEAFAAPVNFNPIPGLVVPKQPPEPINEIPAEVKPEGDVIWISGYWAWDDQKEDFIWVSGVYRKVPQNRRWVPGYWSKVEKGFQWTQGFWAPVETTELDYLPTPPDSQENGPSSPSPSDNHFWISGNWVYQDGAYAWQPGYWSEGYENWSWVPHSYSWTPRGCVYVPGYWDYQLADRGVCYAPVYYRQPIYRRAGYFFWPRTLINLGLLHVHLFARPRYRHYYYGDWYGRYPRYGLHPVFDYHGRFGYAPIWNHVAWHFGRRGINYGRRVRGWHRYYRNHQEFRPRRNYQDQQNFIARNKDYKHLRQAVLADDANRALTRNNNRLQRVSQRQRDDFRSRSHEFERISQVRRQERDRLPAARRDLSSVSKQVQDGKNSNRLKLPDTRRVTAARRTIAENRARSLNRAASSGNQARPQFNEYRSRIRRENEQQDRARNVIRRQGIPRTPSQVPIRKALPNIGRSQTRFRAQSPSTSSPRLNYRSPGSSQFRSDNGIDRGGSYRTPSRSYNRSRIGAGSSTFNRSRSGYSGRSSGSSFNRSFGSSRSGSFNRSRGGSFNRSGSRGLSSRSFGSSSGRGTGGYRGRSKR